ncbi:MAG: phosphohydrolase [Candidatus Zixiibacteriota bacterium]|nr:MAG: phosphohydrolase [candidate division Zixibacteria bacterium]
MRARTVNSANKSIIEIDRRWMMTYTGKKFYPLVPESMDVDIRDIAVGLSRTCRFTKQCKPFFSVAQHSILVSKKVSRRYALWGLLHDAEEAYLPDVGRPIKPDLPEIVEIGKAIRTAILSHFNLPALCPPEVKEADNRMLMTEAEQLMYSTEDWEYSGDPYPDIIIEPWSMVKAEKEFLKRYRYLVGK